MSYLNMVESTEELLQDAIKLVKTESTTIRVDKLFDSIVMMEYSWKFSRLKRDKDKIAWALGHSEAEIVLWHSRRGPRAETYAEWRSALVSRFYCRFIEMEKFLNLIKEKEQKVSSFIISIETKGNFLI
jgi:hypothetical protein